MCNEHSHCTIPAAYTRLQRPLFELARQRKGQQPITIVALGSSLTAGLWPVVPYPARLELALRKQMPQRMINVINKGLGGDEAPQELWRLDEDAISPRPALVIWQVGTNAAWKGYELHDVAAAIDVGLKRLAAHRTDVILMDLQYTPALFKSRKQVDDTEDMVRLIASAANNAGVSVFRRFALMQHWHRVDKIPIEAMSDPTDNHDLHQSDWSTASVAQALCAAIMDAADRGVQPP